MADWYKGKEMTFQLKDMGVQEEFTIWKAWDKRNEEIKDLAGNVMQFPIKKGQLTTSKGDIKEFEDVKWMKKKDFEEAFPNLSRNTRYIRNIIIGGVEYVFGFTKTSNDKLVELLESVQGMGMNPLTVSFQQTYNANNSPATKYGMKIVKGANNIPSPVVMPKEVNNFEKEKEVMDAIRSKFGDKKPDITRFVEIMKANGISEDRAKEIFKTF